MLTGENKKSELILSQGQFSKDKSQDRLAWDWAWDITDSSRHLTSQLASRPYCHVLK